jgi:hypothetical protein
MMFCNAHLFQAKTPFLLKQPTKPKARNQCVYGLLTFLIDFWRRERDLSLTLNAIKITYLEKKILQTHV